MQPVRFGLIGCGGIAQSAHLPAMANLHGRVTLVAAADVNVATAKKVAEPWDADYYADYRDVVEREDVDAVVVATPEFAHRETVVAAARAGKHVLCEKPMAPSLDDAEAMIAACRDAGVKLMIGHSRRSTQRYLELRHAIDRGEIGDVCLIRENERRARPPVGQVGTYWSTSHWTGDPQRSVGVALTNAIHETDLFGWFAGSEPTTVYAEHKITREGNRYVPDFITITVRFANGAIASGEVSNCLPRSYPSFHQLEIYGTRGALRARDTDMTSLTRFSDEGADYPHRYEMLLHNLDAYTRQMALFVDTLVEGRPLPLTPQESYAALRLALAAVESAGSGRAVHLAPTAEGGKTS